MKPCSFETKLSVRVSQSNAFSGSLAAALLMTLALSSKPALAGTCESLSSLKLPDTTITLAQTVAAGEFTPPAGALPQPAIKDLPAFCRVAAQISPTKDSDIRIEVWMPLTGWNGKLQSRGNGGFAGDIGYPAMAGAVSRGYASAGTDTGHSGSPVDASWALGHPEKIIDFGYRAIHEMTMKSKAILQAFYGEGPKHSYFASCSNGGRQALMEAQRFPEDYDGIIAGAPAHNWTRLMMAGAWDLQALHVDPAGYVPAAKVPALGAAVVAACDKLDGVSDGVLNDPRDCRFDPSTLLCKGSDSNSCLTAPQSAAIKKLYAGPRNSKGKEIYPGYLPGGEEGGGGWYLWISGRAPQTSLQYLFTAGFFRNMMYNDPAWDFRTFNFDTDVKLVDDKAAATFNATDPDLKAFHSRGGKLILYHGWDDAAITALGTINYYNNVAAILGARSAESSVRLYLVPGMQHCGGGPGATNFGESGDGPLDPQHNVYTALEQWVEKGAAPGKIVATKYLDDLDPAQGVKMTRPLCPYPQTAKYKGTGDANDEASFVCAPGKK